MSDSGRHNSGPWIGGGILIALGLIFLLEQMGVSLPANWWAIFLAVPAVGGLIGAWRAYQREGTIRGPAVGGLITGVILGVIAIAVFLGFNLGAIWPILLILLGIVVIAGNAWRGR